MIKINKNKITCELSKDGKGVIVIRAKDNFLTLQQIKPNSNIKIGDKVDKESIKELPSITLEFHKPESIDAFIKVLEKVKENIEFPYGYLPYAC